MSRSDGAPADQAADDALVENGHGHRGASPLRDVFHPVTERRRCGGRAEKSTATRVMRGGRRERPVAFGRGIRLRREKAGRRSGAEERGGAAEGGVTVRPGRAGTLLETRGRARGADDPRSAPPGGAGAAAGALHRRLGGGTAVAADPADPERRMTLVDAASWPPRVPDAGGPDAA